MNVPAEMNSLPHSPLCHRQRFLRLNRRGGSFDVPVDPLNVVVGRERFTLSRANDPGEAGPVGYVGEFPVSPPVGTADPNRIANFNGLAVKEKEAVSPFQSWHGVYLRAELSVGNRGAESQFRNCTQPVETRRARVCSVVALTSDFAVDA